ncbi:XdhC family protein [Aliiroseovarius sp. S1339]|uniref:XdhC family protein n=1 Tax=Aliiroseovarius sp. S1339 TaxID=2936990 RepID=UPI0020BEFFA5|nr:XdhC/CoxI family protein [Aliiroseovarius sp. S1339]MCK8464780.1 XdhC family protein [Aliiroseovarius sp. S1339]
MADVTGLKTVPETALHWHCAGRRVAIATVVETWGSAPCPAGSQVVIADDGAIEGSVSGGCVEGAVVAEAQAALEVGVPRLLTYGVTDDDAFAAGLACGGTIRILVEPVTDGDGSGLPVAILSDLVEKRAARVAVMYEVNLSTWVRRLLAMTLPLPNAETGVKGDLFVAIHTPPPRLILVGAVHIAQVLAPMAAAAGFDPVVIDPRSSFATPERFPTLPVICDDTEAALVLVGVDPQTAIVTLGHDPKIDDPAILKGLAKGAFYIGCLGSRRTHRARLDRLRAAGVLPADVSRVHGPVGLDIGAKGPAEIAVSIMAELIAARRGKV